MATKKTAAAKVAATVSPDPDTHEEGGAAPAAPVEDAPQEDAPDDVTVIIPDEMEAAPAPAPAPAATTPGGGLNAGDPTGYAAWVVPAPAPLATAAVGSAGYYVGIRQGVEDRAAPFAAWLGTDAPKASWPA